MPPILESGAARADSANVGKSLVGAEWSVLPAGHSTLNSAKLFYLCYLMTEALCTELRYGRPTREQQTGTEN